MNIIRQYKLHKLGIHIDKNYADYFNYIETLFLSSNQYYYIGLYEISVAFEQNDIHYIHIVSYLNKEIRIGTNITDIKDNIDEHPIFNHTLPKHITGLTCEDCDYKSEKYIEYTNFFEYFFKKYYYTIFAIYNHFNKYMSDKITTLDVPKKLIRSFLYVKSILRKFYITPTLIDYEKEKEKTFYDKITGDVYIRIKKQNCYWELSCKKEIWEMLASFGNSKEEIKGILMVVFSCIVIKNHSYCIKALKI